jgi:hypothetical protein
MRFLSHVPVTFVMSDLFVLLPWGLTEYLELYKDSIAHVLFQTTRPSYFSTI